MENKIFVSPQPIHEIWRKEVWSLYFYIGGKIWMIYVHKTIKVFKKQCPPFVNSLNKKTPHK